MSVPALQVVDHLTDAELEERANGARKRVWEWARWRAILLFKQGESAIDIARFLARKEDWVRRTVRSYNAKGPDFVRDLREDNGAEGRVGPELMAALVEAVQHEEPPGGGRWTGGKARVWLNSRLDKPIPTSTAYNTLHRAKLSWQVPRPRSVEADAQAQDDFKKKNTGGQSPRGSANSSPRRSLRLGRG